MNSSIFNFRDDEEREMFFVAIPVIALFALLGYWLMKGEAPVVEPQALAAVATDVDSDGIIDSDDQCINLPGTIATYGCPVETVWAERDNDKDGLRNGLDSCPQTKGSIDNNGCVAAISSVAEPIKHSDQDGDGFVDSEDDCPSVAGDNGNGCPTDTDSDGVIDKNDDCIAEPGPIETAGCPVNSDRDGDGVLNDVDQCPDETGLSTNNGCPVMDADNDGVIDSLDECPAVAGNDNGCPADSDNDGVSDAQDSCPQLVGDARNQGCPSDTDGDGVADDADECPSEVGSVATNGCPVVVNVAADTDGDGMPDTEDNCPAIKGVASNSGCPNDTDGDGVADAEDECPGVAGEVSALGCPLSSAPDQVEVKRVLDAAISGVKFNSSSAVLTLNSREILNSVVELLDTYPDTVLEIKGHTDSSGNAEKNMLLSLERARSCAAYIEAQGISNDRLKFFGYGDTEPLEDNATISGRESNRRVEFELK